MKKELLRKWLLDTAASFNQTLGQMIFTGAGLMMLACSVFSMPILYIAVLVAACSLAWIFRSDLRNTGQY